MKKLLFCVVIISHFTCIGQGIGNIKADSIRLLISKLPSINISYESDNHRIKLLIQLSEIETNKLQKVNYLQEALSITSDSKNYKLQLNVVLKLVDLYKEQLVRKNQYLLQALALAEKVSANTETLQILSSLSNSYNELGDHSIALRYANDYYEHALIYGTLEQQLLGINRIGTTYFRLEAYDEALKYYEQCQDGNKRLQSNKVKNAYLINSAMVYSQRKDYDRAITNLAAAVSIDDGYADKETFLNNELAKLYFQKRDIEQAIRYAKISERSSEDLRPILQLATIETLKDIYKYTGNSKQYTTYLEKYTDIKLREDSTKNARLVEFMNLDYETEKQKQELGDLNEEYAKQDLRNSILIAISLTTLLILLALGWFYNLLRKKNIQIQEQSIQIETINKSLEEKVQHRTKELSNANSLLVRKNFEITEALFKGQSKERQRVAAELHDNLGGTLTAIKWRLEAIESSDLDSRESQIYEGIKKMMNSAYNDVRNLSHHLYPQEFEAYGLEKSVDKLILGYNSTGIITFTCEVAIENSLSKELSFNLYCIIIELVTNVIKHAQASKCHIDLNSDASGVFSIHCSDNGIGINQEGSEGMGLENVRRRLEDYTSEITFNSTDEWNTIITIRAKSS